MSTYKLTIKIDPVYQKKYQANGMKLCFATSTGVGAKSFNNVVAFTKNIAPNINITWEDQWKIAAANSEISNGATFTCSSDVIDVDLGNETIVNHDWTIQTNPTGDPKREGSFIFKNKGIEAAAVLYRKIEGDFKAVYYSHSGPLAKGSTEIMTPKNKVYVWFSDYYEDQTMIDETIGSIKEIDMTGKKTASVAFSNEGIWINV